MNTNKYAPGQSVKIKMDGHNWDEDYEVPAIIVRPDNVYLNGIPTYIVKVHWGEMWKKVSENRIVLDEEKK